MNPYIARIGRYVFPDPTPKDLRVAKAEAFLELTEFGEYPEADIIQSYLGQSCDRIGQDTTAIVDSNEHLRPTQYSAPSDGVYSTNRTTYSHQRCGLGFPVFDERVRDSQAIPMLGSQPGTEASQDSSPTYQLEFADAAVSVLESNVEPSLVLSFEALGDESPTRLAGAHSLWPHPLSMNSILPETSALPDAGSLLITQRKKRHSRFTCYNDTASMTSKGEKATRDEKTQESLIHSDFRFSTHTDGDIDIDRCTPEPQKRAANRNARLIDGIFRKKSSQDDNPGIPATSSKRSSAVFSLISWPSGQQKTQLDTSLPLVARGNQRWAPGSKTNKTSSFFQHWASVRSLAKFTSPKNK